MSSDSQGSASVPPRFEELVEFVSNFKPKSEADLLDFLATQASGMSAHAEAWADLAEACVTTMDLPSPAADAVIEAAEAMAKAAERLRAILGGS